MASARGKDEGLDSIIQRRGDVIAVAERIEAAAEEFFPVVSRATVSLAVDVHLETMSFIRVGTSSTSNTGKCEPADESVLQVEHMHFSRIE